MVAPRSRKLTFEYLLCARPCFGCFVDIISKQIKFIREIPFKGMARNLNPLQQDSFLLVLLKVVQRSLDFALSRSIIENLSRYSGSFNPLWVSSLGMVLFFFFFLLSLKDPRHWAQASYMATSHSCLIPHPGLSHIREWEDPQTDRKSVV